MKTKKEKTDKTVNGSWGEAFNSYLSYRQNHPMLQEARRRVTDAAKRNFGPQVIIATGPTGVGKTVMARQVYLDLQKEHAAAMNADQGIVPVIGLSAVPPHGSAFNWKDFYIRVLERQGEPLTNRKLLVPKQQEIFLGMGQPSTYDRSKVDALHRCVESYLRMRKTKVLVIDEAHHILMVKNRGELEAQFETLKSLTIETGITIILVGTYNLLEIRDQSGQLNRRAEIIPMQRYDRRKKGDLTAFTNATRELVGRMPLKQPPNIDIDYFYAKSVGCIGILKDWLDRCLHDALEQGMPTFNLDFAEERALQNKSLKRIVTEAMLGEEKMADDNLESIKSLLANGLTGYFDDEDTTSSSSSSRNVGNRNPVRDPVGGYRHACAS